MAGSYDTAPSPHHLQAAHQDHYNLPPHYASYNVQPPLGSDSGSAVSVSGGYVPLPPGSFSPQGQANNKEYQSQQHHLQQQHLVATTAPSSGGVPNNASHEHWNNNDILWAIATWVLMFVPAMLSLAIEVTLERSKESLIKVMGHLPLFQLFYHIYIIRQLKAQGDEIQDHEKFYTDLDFDDLPDGIQTELRTRCNKRRTLFGNQAKCSKRAKNSTSWI